MSICDVFIDDMIFSLTPTMAVPAFDVGYRSPFNFETSWDWSPFSYPFNLTQQPAVFYSFAVSPRNRITNRLGRSFPTIFAKTLF